MEISEIKSHPNNTATFRDLAGEEFEDLKASIRDHGIIEPVVINQHGVIICGHQRVRACVELGIADVPVVVREVATDEEHETLLIEENLRRRQLLPSESFKAVKRLYELRGIKHGGDKQTATVAACSVAELACELGKSERSVRTMRTLADLIEPLATMLDRNEITQAVAYQLAQLDADGQKSMESWMGLKELSEMEAKRVKREYFKAKAEADAHAKKVSDLEAALSDLSKKLPTDDVLATIASLTAQLKAANEKPPVTEVVTEIVREVVEPEDYQQIKAQNAEREAKIRALSDDIKKQRERFDKDRATFETALSNRMAAQIKAKEDMLEKLRREMDERYAKLDAMNKESGMILPAKELARRIERNLEDIAAGLEEFFEDLGSYDIPKESAPILRKLADMMMEGAEGFDAILQRKEKTVIEVN